MTGVYVLLYKKKVVYIGQTKHWPARVTQHKHMKFDEARLIECSVDDLRYFESKLIRIFKPKINSRTVKKLITDEWIIDNSTLIGACNNRKELNAIANNAKTIFGYSPMYSPHDLAWTIIRGYCRIYKMQWSYKKEKFKPLKQIKEKEFV